MSEEMTTAIKTSDQVSLVAEQEGRDWTGMEVQPVPEDASDRCVCGHTREAHSHGRAPGCSLCQCAAFAAAPVQVAQPLDKQAAAITAFQGAARRMMRRMHEDERFHYVMHGTAVYAATLEAFAISVGVELPEDASLRPVIEMWTLLHPNKAN